MKQIFLFVLALALFSCNSPQSVSLDEAYELDDLLVVAEHNVDSTVTVMGYVTHTCKHSGMKCFIVGESQKVSFQVLADGEISGFSPELEGSKLAITGVLKEHHLSSESINAKESNALELQHQEGMAEACAAELSNVEEMRAWMLEHDKDHYVMYYMEGLKYEVVD